MLDLSQLGIWMFFIDMMLYDWLNTEWSAACIMLLVWCNGQYEFENEYIRGQFSYVWKRKWNEPSQVTDKWQKIKR